MRIVLVALSNAPSLQRYAAFAAAELATRHDVHVVCTRHTDRSLFAYGGPVHRIGSTRTPRPEPQMLNVLSLGRIAVLIRRLRPDVVHFTSAHPWNLVLAALLPQQIRVFTVHDVVPHPDEAVTRFVACYNYAVFQRLAHRVIVHGASHLERIRELGFRTDHVRYVPLGEVNMPLQTAPLPREKRVLFFGRIMPYKGLPVLLRAAQLVLAEHPEALFVIAGQGDLHACRDLLAGLSIELHNRFIREEEVPDFFNRARLVVLPYTSATQSGVIPLAYAYRRPVVVTDVGALREMVRDGETGLIVPPGSPLELARAVSLLLGDYDRCLRMGQAGFRLYREAYTPKQMAEEFEKVYQEVCLQTVGDRRCVSP